jgi:hypothetical protein
MNFGRDNTMYGTNNNRNRQAGRHVLFRSSQLGQERTKTNGPAAFVVLSLTGIAFCPVKDRVAFFVRSPAHFHFERIALMQSSISVLTRNASVTPESSSSVQPVR